MGLLKNHSGFALVYLISVLPFILTLFILLGAWGAFTKTSESMLHTCREELIGSQAIAAKGLEKLFTLNALAKLLRIEKRIAQGELVIASASGDIPAMIKAENDLLQVVQKQSRLDRMQRSIILAANQQLILTASLTTQKMKQKFNRFNTKWHQFIRITGSSIYGVSGQLAIHPDEPTEVAPVYELDSPFHSRQMSQVFWKDQYQIGPESWAHKWSSLKFLKQDSCSVSIEEWRGKWTAKPIEDKSY